MGDAWVACPLIKTPMTLIPNLYLYPMESGYPSKVSLQADIHTNYGYSNQQFANSGPMGVTAPMQPIGAHSSTYMSHNANIPCQGDIGIGSDVGANSMVGLTVN